MGVSEKSSLLTPQAELSSQQFARLFIAALAARGRTAIMPNHPSDRAGLYKAFLYVRALVDDLRSSNDRDSDWYYSLVRVRNALKPSNNGSFDTVESLLRSQQLSLTSSPNPFYEQIALSVSKSYAEAMLSELNDREREFVSAVVDQFLEGQAAV